MHLLQKKKKVEKMNVISTCDEILIKVENDT